MAALLDANQDPSRANDENAKYDVYVILQGVCKTAQGKRAELTRCTDFRRTLWMGDLAYWMDENFLYSLFVPTGALQTVKIIRNKASNASEGYGFVEFATHAAAEDVLQTLNGTPIPNTDQIFRLNWAAFGVGKQTQEGTDNSKPVATSCCLALVCCCVPTREADCAWAAVHVDHSIFVGDLAPEVTDYMLQEHFRQYYPSVRSAKVTSPAADKTWNTAYCSLDTRLPSNHQ